MTYILNEDTQPVIRAIGVSHTACTDDFRRRNLDLTAGVYFYFIIKHAEGCPYTADTYTTWLL